MNDRQNRFIKLLEEIFEINKSDLDFGIYRILNFKRSEIIDFFRNRLPQLIEEQLAPYATAINSGHKNRMAEIEAQFGGKQVLEGMTESIPIVAEYKRLVSQHGNELDMAALESDVYSALYSFFNRYYEEGDFISKRRYKEGVYAIPYEGEEVKLYWANQDQYYIKTSENFKDYTFMAEDITVHFRLVNATTEQNNNKENENEKRVFMLFEENEEYPDIKTFSFTPETKEFIIRFVYDIPKDKKRKYTEENYKTIVNYIASEHPDLISRLMKNTSAKPNEIRPLILKHLEGYVAKNTFDYFIHKDLKGFLSRELDFYIKNEILHIDDIDNENIQRNAIFFAKIRAIKNVANILIDFLAQLENFQKRLWLKKKFVVETNWCITLDNIDESFYPEIAANQAQTEDWIKLFAIDKINTPAFSQPLTIDFLKANTNLVIDTRHFSHTFRDKLIASIDNLDEKTNGILINSDNYQALRLIKNRYRNKVQTIYIDPPYNTDATPILYKNGYRDSSWMSLMRDRLEESKSLLQDTIGYYSIAIDDTELHNLFKLMENVFYSFNIFQVIVNHYPGSGTGRSNISKTHEYCLFAVPKNSDVLRGKPKESEERIRGFCRSGTGDNNFRYGRPNSFYAVLVNPNTHEIKGFENPPSLDETYPTSNTPEGYLRIYPLGADGSERCWTLGYESAKKALKNGMLFCSSNNVVKRKYYDNANRDLLPSIWVDSQYSAVVHGTNLLTKLFGESGKFPFPKSLYTVRDAIEAGTFDDDDALVVDFFGGSGTTAHAVIDLNRKIPFSERKYLLVEMGEYFSSVTKPRIEKVIYSSDWANGIPLNRTSGISQIVKYMRLESYEDALNNIVLNAINTHSSKLNFGDEYIVSYMLDAESKDSMLTTDKFNEPFNFAMTITEQNETHLRQIDLVETFNYLIGLTVANKSAVVIFNAEPASNPAYEGAVELHKNVNGQFMFQQLEGTLPDGRRALVIWRNITDDILKSNAALDAYFQMYRINPRNRDFDVIFVNGDNNIENLRLENETWKVVLTEQEFNKCMWEEE